MKTYTLLVFFLLTISRSVIAQNLVQNGSFEMHTVCQSNIQYVPFWGLVPGNIDSPDYYNSCIIYGFGVPSNIPGFQQAHEGVAYMGIVTGSSGNEFREYIQTQLSEPLIEGNTYDVSFKVSRAENVQYASNNIGAFLSFQPLSGSAANVAISASPQILEQTVVYETQSWQTVSGTFVASGGEQYLTLGNFYDNANTTLEYVNPTGLVNEIYAYYYIDSVEVTLHTLKSDDHERVDFKIFPNPSSEYLILEVQEVEISLIELYSTTGMVKKFNPNMRRLDLLDVASGVYILMIQDDSGQQFITKIVKI
jgi:hypothetical protein